MKKLGVIVVVIAVVLAVAYLLFQKRKVISNDDTGVRVLLSVDGGNCVQSVGGTSMNVVTIPEGKGVLYYTENNVPFSVSFGPAGVISTGSPFRDATGQWQRDFPSANGAPVTTPSSVLTFPEWLFNVTDFPYASITIDNKACTVTPGTGLHVER